jgi:hypothetical protein
VTDVFYNTAPTLCDGGEVGASDGDRGQEQQRHVANHLRKNNGPSGRLNI